MSMSINTNAAAMAALQTLSQTSTQLNKTQNAIATGKAVNSASDDPAVYSIAQGMNSQISALSGVSTGLKSASSVLDTSSKVVTNISTSLSALTKTATEAATGSLPLNQLTAQIVQTLNSINVSATAGATSQGVNLLSGSVGSNGAVTNTLTTAQDINGNLFSQSGFNATAAGLGLSGLSANQTGQTIDISALTDTDSDATTAAASTLAFTTGAGKAGNPTVSYSFVMDAHGTTSTATPPVFTSTPATSSSSASLTAALGGADATFKVGTDGTITGTNVKNTVTNASNGSTTYTMKDGSSITAAADASGNMTYTKVAAGDVDANGNATKTTVVVDVNTNSANNQTGADAVKIGKRNALMNAMNNIGAGTSLDSTGKLTFAGANISASSAAATLGVAAGTAAATATSSQGTSNAVLAIQGATTKIGNISSSIGASINAVTQLSTSTSTLSDALTTSVGNLTDADLAAESAKLTSLQTKQQLAIQSLSIANSQSSQIMSLFRG